MDDDIYCLIGRIGYAAFIEIDFGNEGGDRVYLCEKRHGNNTGPQFTMRMEDPNYFPRLKGVVQRLLELHREEFKKYA